MLVEDEPLKTVLCGVTAEPMNFAPGFTAATLKSFGMEGQGRRFDCGGPETR